MFKIRGWERYRFLMDKELQQAREYPACLFVLILFDQTENHVLTCEVDWLSDSATKDFGAQAARYSEAVHCKEYRK
jgi:hypothetical protein